MAKYFIRRSDGIVQRYKLSPKRLAFYTSELTKITFKKSTRIRRVFEVRKVEVEMKAPVALEQQPVVAKPEVRDIKTYTKVKKVTTDVPLPNTKGQIHVEIEALKGGIIRKADGYSYFHYFDTKEQKDKAYQEAINHALFLIDGYPDRMHVVKYDYVYLIPK